MTDAAGEPQDVAEGLDDDKLPIDYPPDRPLGVNQYGTTGGEQAYAEPLDEWVRREEPDPVVEADAAISEDREPVIRAPRDVDPLDRDEERAGDDTRGDVAQEREAPLAAEEDAIHVERQR